VFILQTGFHEDDNMLVTHPNRERSLAPRRRRGVQRHPLELLEDRTLLSGGGLVPSLVALGGATPRPIPLPASLLPITGTSALSGPDVYLNFPGPATAAAAFGNEPNAITDFSGVYGGAAVEGSGTDGQGNTLYWASDIRFMKGEYRGANGGFYHGTFVEI
jgi:hypothetical protein